MAVEKSMEKTVEQMKTIKAFTTEYDLYLQDESKKRGYADTISFPKTVEEISEILSSCSAKSIPVTVQGSRTGVGSGAVPFGGHVMSMEKLRTLKMGSDGNTVIASAGRTLNEINEFVRKSTGNKLFLPPDPTEGTASAGGIVSCNSSGARTYRYGAMRDYVKSLKLVMADGTVLKIERGKYFAKRSTLEISDDKAFVYSPENEHTSNIGGDGVAVIGAEHRPPNKIIRIDLPKYNMPNVKNAAGYYVRENMDAIDLFIGAEGTLGVVVEVEFSLAKNPELIWGVISYFPEEEMGIRFAQILKSEDPRFKKSNGESCKDKSGEPGGNIMSIEFFDGGSLRLLREKGWKIQGKFSEAVFIELKAENMDVMVENLKLVEKYIIKAGGSPDDAQVAGTRSFQDFKKMRHATPEAVNEKIAQAKKKCPVITKLGSDMSVPPEYFNETVKMYKADLKKAGLDYVIFGHIGNEHLHVNIISHSEEEYLTGKKIFLGWAEKIGKIGGSVSAEHGIGKLKRDFLTKMYGKSAVDEMREVKKALDPCAILGRDNIFLWNTDEK